MKKLFLLLPLLVLLFGCSDSSSYKITGRVSSDKMNGKTVYLENYLWHIKMSNLRILDSAVIHGNKFTFKGKADSSYLALLSIDNTFKEFFLENGNINVEVPENLEQSVVTGSKLNDLFNSYLDSLTLTKNKINELGQYARSQEATDEFKAEITEKFTVLLNEMIQISAKFLDENPGTVLSAYVLQRAISLGFEGKPAQNAYDKLDENVKNSTWGKIILQEIAKMKYASIETGEMFRDLTMQTPDGKNVSISDYAGKGKYVLIDFWASWCKPCRNENPNVVALYKDYKDKDFEIIGVSLDQNKDMWIKGIEDDGIAWPQMSDLKGWDSDAVAKYRIKGIPFTVLLDKGGKIIDINLRGTKLRDKIKSLIP